tara:strand:+ start:111 stop:596 length:486 start_codon:yes stop_codon:yes gene_type:complete
METKIYYKITFPNNTCYVGKTKNYKHRCGIHKNKCKHQTHPNKNLQEIYNKYSTNNWVFEWLFVGVGDKEYHKIREYTLIQETPNTINLNTGKKCLDEKTYHRLKDKEYYNQNPEYKRKRQVKYQSKKEYLKQYAREYRIKNKDLILQKQREKRKLKAQKS